MPTPNDAKNPAVFLRTVLSTTKRAGAFLDLLVDRLQGRALSIDRDEGRSRQVFVSEEGGVVPWPIATLAITAPDVLDAHEADADAEPEESWKASPAPGEGRFIPLTFRPVAATLGLGDGETRLCVNYGRDTRAVDVVGPLDAAMFASIEAALAAGNDSRLELLAAWVAGLEVGRYGPARVVVPRPTARPPQGAWVIGRSGIRRAIAAGRAPVAASWAVADGVAGTAVAFGATRDEALASWREVVARVRPTPPPPPPQPEPGTTFEPTSWAPEREGLHVELRGRADAAGEVPFDGSPAAIPAAVVPLSAARDDASVGGAWERFLGDRGATEYALRVPRGRGYQLVGEALAGKVDLASLDGARRRAQRGGPGPELRKAWAARSGVELTTSIRWFRCVDAATGAPCPPTVQLSAQTPAFDAATFDADALRHSIVEVSPID